MPLRIGDYAKQTSQPGWGTGRVVSIDDRNNVTIFFLRGGRRVFKANSSDLEIVDGRDPTLEIAGRVDWSRSDRNLYVVELNPKIFEWERRFFEANLHWIPGKPCVYVGMTGLIPEERFRAHLNGKHSAWFVRKYGCRLLPELYQQFNPLPYELAVAMEGELARQLREDGLGVWQN